MLQLAAQKAFILHNNNANAFKLIETNISKMQLKKLTEATPQGNGLLKITKTFRIIFVIKSQITCRLFCFQKNQLLAQNLVLKNSQTYLAKKQNLQLQWLIASLMKWCVTYQINQNKSSCRYEPTMEKLLDKK